MVSMSYSGKDVVITLVVPISQPFRENLEASDRKFPDRSGDVTPGLTFIPIDTFSIIPAAMLCAACGQLTFSPR